MIKWLGFGGIFLFAVILVVGCSKKKKEAPTESNAASYIPFTQGNFWKYRVQPANADSSAYSAIMKISGTAEIQGEKWVVMETRNTKSPNNWTKQYFQVRDKALLLAGWESYNAATGDTSRMFFDAPVKWVSIPFEENKNWTIYHYAGSLTEAPLAGSVLKSSDLDNDGKPEQVDLTIAGQSFSEETIEAAGKSFQAVRIDININAAVTMSQTHLSIPYTLKFGSFWFAPEVGIVKILQYDPNGKVTETWLLESYYLAPVIGSY